MGGLGVAIVIGIICSQLLGLITAWGPHESVIPTAAPVGNCIGAHHNPKFWESAGGFG
jgi:hypothetical protein